MRLSKFIAALAATSLVAAPALAAPANPAQSLSLAKSVRASAPAAKGSKLADGPSVISATVLIGLVVAGIIVAITSGGDDDKPASA